MVGVVEGGGAGEVEQGGGFAHCGAGGQDDEVAGLPAAGEAVELGEAGGDAGEALAADGTGEVVEGGGKGGGGGLAGAGFEGAVEIGEVGLGVGQQGQRVAGVVVAVGGQLGAGADDNAAGVLLLQDAAVGFEVGGGVDFGGEVGHEGRAADALQGALVAQLDGDGEQVGVLALPAPGRGWPGTPAGGAAW